MAISDPAATELVKVLQPIRCQVTVRFQVRTGVAKIF